MNPALRAEHPLHDGGVLGDEGQQDAGGAFGAAALLFPVQERGRCDADGAGEIGLAEPGRGADGADVWGGDLDVVGDGAFGVAVEIGFGLFEALHDAGEGFGHGGHRLMDGLVLCGGGVGVNGIWPNGETGPDKMGVGVGCALCAHRRGGFGRGRGCARSAHPTHAYGFRP